MGYGGYYTLSYLSENGKEISGSLAIWSAKIHSMDPGPTLMTRMFAWESIDLIDFDKVDPESPIGLLIGDDSELLKKLQLTTEGLKMDAAHAALQEDK